MIGQKLVLRFTPKNFALLLSVPVLGGLAYTLSKNRFNSVADDSFDFADSRDIDALRMEWKKRNNGFGLRDVNRSCGGSGVARAFNEEWIRVDGKERGRLLNKLASLIEAMLIN
ncbi:9314_t:CDS:2 [Cetraspora pellucida]|uniref:9314_t:CDS:1 n=1 Tax=Cetraspora pellucida TaxID=1433469 RepID=A0A9N9BEP7_9GLOM|nr:9314_t:CDS:2 [Cetraspora pellucida]